ncbi:hypothetical protein GIB67_036672, partial [Kingdonia uniflora]
EPGCLRVHHHAPTWHLDKEPTIVLDLVILAGLDKISEISYEHYNARLIFAICEHWQPEMNTLYFSWGEITLSLDDVQHLIVLAHLFHNLGAASRTDGKQFAAYMTLFESTECEQLRVTIEQMKESKIFNDVVHKQFIKSFEELPAKLEEKEAWRHVMKKEFQSEELADKEDPTFIELFNQYN